MNPPVASNPPSTIKLQLPTQRGNYYYDGKWHEPRAGQYLDSINPGTAKSLGHFADSTAEDVDLAVASALRWSATIRRARSTRRTPATTPA